MWIEIQFGPLTPSIHLFISPLFRFLFFTPTPSLSNCCTRRSTIQESPLVAYQLVAVHRYEQQRALTPLVPVLESCLRLTRMIAMALRRSRLILLRRRRHLPITTRLSVLRAVWALGLCAVGLSWGLCAVWLLTRECLRGLLREAGGLGVAACSWLWLAVAACG